MPPGAVLVEHGGRADGEVVPGRAGRGPARRHVDDPGAGARPRACICSGRDGAEAEEHQPVARRRIGVGAGRNVSGRRAVERGSVDVAPGAAFRDDRRTAAPCPSQTVKLTRNGFEWPAASASAPVSPCAPCASVPSGIGHGRAGDRRCRERARRRAAEPVTRSAARSPSAPRRGGVGPGSPSAGVDGRPRGRGCRSDARLDVVRAVAVRRRRPSRGGRRGRRGGVRVEPALQGRGVTVAIGVQEAAPAGLSS